MARARSEPIAYEVVELGGVRYAVVRESVLVNLCRATGAALADPVNRRAEPRPDLVSMEEFDGPALAERLIARRKSLGLSQVDLAQRAGVRIETLNRIERAKVTPDFATIRKLVVALKQAEAIPGLSSAR